jgi:hypothetical protein
MTEGCILDTSQVFWDSAYSKNGYIYNQLLQEDEGY